MKMEDATRFTEKCFNGEPASCSFACPFHLDIRSFLEKAGKGRWTAAYKELRNAVVFPVIVSVLCDQPCRNRCQRTLIGDEALALQDIESAVIKYANNRKPDAYFIPPKTKSVAVIGAGAAGLSCALNLAQKKYPVTVYERGDGWGGSLRNHPRFSEFDKDIALQFSTVDVSFQFGTQISDLGRLEEFDAIYLATGAGGEAFGLLESWDGELLTTSHPKVFMGGALCGASLMEGIAQGPALSKVLEVFLQTGKASGTYGGYHKNDCGHYLKHENVTSSALIKAAVSDGYTEEEAKQEASRCLKCDCEACMNACEMLKRFRKKPHRIAVEVFTDSQAAMLSSRSLTRETYSCNICGYCKSICPEHVDMGDLLQFSRAARTEAGIHPPALHDFWMREMDFASTEAFFASAPKGRESCEYAFFPGCQLGASKPEYVFQSYGFLQKNYDAGIIMSCCGAPAYWAGDEPRLKRNVEKIRESWKAMGSPVLVFACATCESIFYQFIPEIPRISLYELLAPANEITPVSPFPAAAVFDPCAAREDHGMEQGVRKIAAKAGTVIHEMKEHNRCCGYGGHMRIANPSLYEEIAGNRVKAAEEPYFVYCVNCREVFASKNKECVHILDVAFGLDGSCGVPDLQQKRENSLNVKKKLMKELTGVDFQPESHPWDELTLLINDDVRSTMEKKLITDADVREAIWLAVGTEDLFYDETDGTCLCSLVKSVITYWVHYKETDSNTYEILSAYCHRMRFNREG